ncbi:MAG: glycosyltransferase family 39 protein, partial [Armatimonadetes bacterium]|nr:glycosyltransferase family 39 protein [Anaerolineae bacterium]
MSSSVETSPNEILPQDLPDWMRQAQRRIDWGLPLVLCFTVFSVWMWLLNPGIATYNASLNHAFRAADTATALREGWLYPRWSPHVLGGFGAPIPHYTPPGASYVVAVVEVLLTDDPISALRLVVAVSQCLAACAVYGLATRWSGGAGGMLAALLYVFSPYIGLTAPHILGDLPGVLALALLPGLLWAANSLLLSHRALDFTLTALLAVALAFTEPSYLLAGLPLLIGLAIMQAVTQQRAPWRGGVLLAAITLGSLLAAAFWLPALLEYAAITWYTPPLQPLRYPLTIAGLLTPLQALDAANLTPAPALTLGWALAGFTLVGGLGAIAQRRLSYPLMFLGVGVSITLITLLALPSSTGLLGIITLCAALVSSAVPRLWWGLSAPLQRLALPGALALVLIGALPVWLAPVPLQTTQTVTPLDQLRYEQQGLGTAVLPFGAALPSTLPPPAQPDRTLLSSYQFNASDAATDENYGDNLDNLDKIAPPQLTRSGQINILQQDTHTARYLLRFDQPLNNTLQQPVAVTWLTAYFPGWQATLDGV